MSSKELIVLKDRPRGLRIQLGENKWIDICHDNFTDCEICASSCITIYPAMSNVVKLNIKEMQ